MAQHSPPRFFFYDDTPTYISQHPQQGGFRIEMSQNLRA
jgi:hypothetical protein